MSYEVEEIKVVELYMMDKRKYYPLTLASGLCIRSMLYPFMLIKTRLQIQKGHTVYRGTFHALHKIGVTEGVSGLYRGFWVSCLQLIPSMAYITSYETTRHHLSERGITDNRIRSFISGGVASVIGQTIAVPVDITNQHLMLMGHRESASSTGESSTEKKMGDGRTDQKSSSSPQNLQNTKNTQNPPSSSSSHPHSQRIHITEEERKSRIGSVRAVVRSVYRQNGLLGFYKGYFVSLACFAPNSALWWLFYDHYCEFLSSVLPSFVPHLGIQVMAAPMGAVSSALLTNPLDIIRARIQVEGTRFGETVRVLWAEEKGWIMTKGLSARLIHSVTFSFFLMLGYETIKRWSVTEEYKHRVRW